MKKEKLSFGTEIESRFIKNIVIYRNQNVFLLNLDELLKLEELSVEVNNG
jgi:hypothetical protein